MRVLTQKSVGVATATRIDCIFVRCGEHEGATLDIRSCERIFDEPTKGVWASDHFGLVADLEVP